MTGRGLLAIGILAFQFVVSARAADDLASGVKNLLATGLKPSTKALTAARTEYAALAKRSDFDARAKYAFALVLIQQRQFAEARKLLEESLAEEPQMLPAWRAKIWADLVSRSYAAALTDMRAAADQLAKVDADPSGVDREERQSLARLLGRGIGFLHASEKTGIPAARLKAEREEILAKVGSDRSEFLISEQMIGTEIGEIDKKLAALRQNEDRAAAQKQQEQDQRRRAVGKQMAEVDYQLLKNEAESGTQLRSSDWEIEQLEKQLAKEQFEANMLEMAMMRQQAFLQRTAASLQQAEADRAAGKIVNESQLVGNGMTIAPANAMLKQLGERRILVVQQMAETQSQLQAAMLRRGGLVEKKEAIADELENKSKKLKHGEKKITYARKQAQKPAGSSGAIRALAEQRRAFSGFEPFSFEEERVRLLAWFKN